MKSGKIIFVFDIVLASLLTAAGVVHQGLVVPIMSHVLGEGIVEMLVFLGMMFLILVYALVSRKYTSEIVLKYFIWMIANFGMGILHWLYFLSTRYS